VNFDSVNAGKIFFLLLLLFFQFCAVWLCDSTDYILCCVFSALSINSTDDSLVPSVKKMRVHPPSANRIPLPDGRHMAYLEQGVPADRARFSVIVPHSFLSSRLAGMYEELGFRGLYQVAYQF
jgi:hypothetical protein